jgi:hypothetical protein
MSYMYTLEDEDGHEIIGYHWHPEGESDFRRPHLHLGYGAEIGRVELEDTKAHIPTGRVALEDFIELLIRAFRIEERRDDWGQILQASAETFRKYGKWW